MDRIHKTLRNCKIILYFFSELKYNTAINTKPPGCKKEKES